jgi:hypothetical protein
MPILLRCCCWVGLRVAFCLSITLRLPPPPVVLVTTNITPSSVVSRAIAPDVGSSVVGLLIGVSCFGEVARDVVVIVIVIVSWYTPRLTVSKLSVSVVKGASSG